MKILTLSLGLLQTNCYIVWNEQTKNAAVLDPAADAEEIFSKVKALDLTVSAVFLTHGHFDHMEALDFLLDDTKADFYMSESDLSLLTDPSKNCKQFMLQRPFSVRHCPTKLLKDGDIVSVDTLSFRAIETPGHTAGSLCYLASDFLDGSEALFTGDLLFSGMIGRTDLPTGNSFQMKTSLEKICSFSKDFVIYPGHGPETSLEKEKKNNIYLQHL